MITQSTNRFEDFTQEFKGLSTDSKPTEGVDTNALFLELDTGDFYYYDTEGGWTKIGASPSSGGGTEELTL